MKQLGKRSKLVTFGIFGVIAIGIVSAQIMSTQIKKSKVVVKNNSEENTVILNKDRSPLFLDEDTHWADSVLATLTLEQKSHNFSWSLLGLPMKKIII